MAMWRGRQLAFDIRVRIATITVFFLAISSLQIVTPTAMTVETTNRTVYTASTVSLLLADDATVSAMFNFTPEGLDKIGRVGSAYGSLPYVWTQRDRGIVGAPPGFNGT